MTELAIEKLDKELAELGKEKKPSNHVAAMKDAVHAALTDFCRQDGEFAQAVCQGGSFADCMRTVAGGVKNGSISDLDAYRLAVQFYFPGADIQCRMTVNLCAGVEQCAEPPEPDAAKVEQSRVVLDLFDLL